MRFTFVCRKAKSKKVALIAYSFVDKANSILKCTRRSVLEAFYCGNFYVSFVTGTCCLISSYISSAIIEIGTLCYLI